MQTLQPQKKDENGIIQISTQSGKTETECTKLPWMQDKRLDIMQPYPTSNNMRTFIIV